MCISLVRMSVCVHFSQMFCVFALHARAILNFFFLLLFVRSFCIHMHSRRETDRYDISMPMVFLYRHGSGYFFICFFCSLRCPYMQRPELKIMICFTSFKWFQWCCVCVFFSFRFVWFCSLWIWIVAVDFCARSFVSFCGCCVCLRSFPYHYSHLSR